MSRLTVDAAMLARIRNLREVTEVCDESGLTVGYFHPLKGALAAEESAQSSPFTMEQLQERRRQRSGSSLAEILARLGQP